MKFKVVEAFFDRENFEDKFIKHYEKHVAKDWPTYWLETKKDYIEPISEDEYADIAHELSIQPVKSSDINSGDRYIGFFGKDNATYKYDTLMHEIVIYSSNPHTNYIVTFYKLNSDFSHYKYNKMKAKYYKGEILPYNELYNK